MGDGYTLQSAAAFSSAFRVPPDVVEEAAPANTRGGHVGIYGWKTPRM